MAIYHLSAKVVQRSRGRSATAAAAYRAAEIITCEREGRDHDYTRKRGVDHTALIGWSGDRAALWNAAEAAEKRKDATTAREYELALPVELTRDDQIVLAERFGDWLHDRHGVAVDVALHDLRSGNPHVHILTTTRPVDAEGNALDAIKAQVEWSDKKRKDHRLGPRKAELEAARQQWETMANSALAARGSTARIDHRSLAEQGIDRPAEQHEGTTVRRIEKKAQRRAERQGIDYQPVTAKGGMNHDAREIAAVERAIADLEDERIAAAAAEAADQERREAEAAEQARQAVEAQAQLQGEVEQAIAAAVHAEAARAADALAARQAREAAWREAERQAAEEQGCREAQAAADREREREAAAAEQAANQAKKEAESAEASSEAESVQRARRDAADLHRFALRDAQRCYERDPIAGADPCGVAAVSLRKDAKALDDRADRLYPGELRPDVPDRASLHSAVRAHWEMPQKGGGSMTLDDGMRRERDARDMATEWRRLADKKRATANATAAAYRWWWPPSWQAVRDAEAAAVDAETKAARIEDKARQWSHWLAEAGRRLQRADVAQAIDQATDERFVQAERRVLDWDQQQREAQAAEVPLREAASDLRERAEALEHRRGADPTEIFGAERFVRTKGYSPEPDRKPGAAPRNGLEI